MRKNNSLSVFTISVIIIGALAASLFGLAYGGTGRTPISAADIGDLRAGNVTMTVDTLADLQAVDWDSIVQTVHINGYATPGDGGAGDFHRDTTDHSTETGTGYVDLDSGHGFYAPPESDTSGASGAWVRVSAGFIYPEMAGAIGDGAMDSSGTDDADAINNADLMAALFGEPLVFQRTYRVESQLLHSSGVTWRFENGSTIIRDWTTTDADRAVNATIKSRGADSWYELYTSAEPVPSTVLDGCRLEGSGNLVFSTAARATLEETPGKACQLYYHCDHFYLGPMKIECGIYDWTINLYGDYFVGELFEITGGQRLLEDGLHVIGGSHGRVVSPKVSAGDDCFSFGCVYNMEVNDWIITTPQVFSACAAAFKFIQSRTDGGYFDDEAPTRKVHNIKVVSPKWIETGSASRNGFVRWISYPGYSGGTAAPDTVERCDIIDADFLAEYNGLPSAEETVQPAIYFNGSTDCKITGRASNPTQMGVKMDAGAVRPIVDIVWSGEIDTGAPTYPSRVVEISDEVVDPCVSGTLPCLSRGGILATDVSGALYTKDLVINDVPDSYVGIDLAGTSAAVISRGFTEITGASGATNAYGYGTDAAATLRCDNYLPANLSRLVDYVSTWESIDINMVPGQSREITIGSNAINVYGDSTVTLQPEGGAADSLSTISNGHQNQRLTLTNGDSDPATNTITVTSSGNIDVPSSRVLAANSKLILIYIGSTWRETTFYE